MHPWNILLLWLYRFHQCQGHDVSVWVQVLTTVHQRYVTSQRRPKTIVFCFLISLELSLVAKLQLMCISLKKSACEKVLRCKNFGLKQASGLIGGSRPPNPPPGSATVKAYYDKKKITCLQNIIMLNFNQIFFVAKLLFEWSFSRKSSKYPEQIL